MTDGRIIPLAEVAQHDDDQSLWIVIHGNVYDVTSYANEHPGGIGILLEHAGQDGTDDFEDVGHSSDARTILETMKIGVIAPEEPKVGKECGCVWKRMVIAVPVAVAAVAVLALLVYRMNR